MSEIREMTFRLIIHLFRGAETTPIVQRWQKTALMEHSNPLLLKVDGGWEEDRAYLFSRSGWDEEEGLAVYHPYATHEKLSLLKDLPHFGFCEVDAAGNEIVREKERMV